MLRSGGAKARNPFDGLAELVETKPMLGRDGDRLTEPEREGFVEPGLSSAALAFVRGKDYRLA